jgi:hypothetical protein
MKRSLRRSAHNALTAGDDFGRGVIEQKRSSTRHRVAGSASQTVRDLRQLKVRVASAVFALLASRPAFTLKAISWAAG